MSQDGYQGAEGEGSGVSEPAASEPPFPASDSVASTPAETAASRTDAPSAPIPTPTPAAPAPAPTPTPAAPTPSGANLPYVSTAQRNPYAPSYSLPNSQEDSNNGRGLLLLGVIILLVIGLASFGLYMAFQLTEFVASGKLLETHESANSDVVDDTGRHVRPDKPLTAPLQGKFMIVQQGVDLTKYVPSTEPDDSPKIQHPNYYATILDDESKVVQEGKLPYNMEGILKPTQRSLFLYQAKDVLKQISDPGPVDPDLMEQFGKFLYINTMITDGDMTYASVDTLAKKTYQLQSLVLAYNHKTGKAQYLAEVPMGIRVMTAHAGKIYIGGEQFNEDDPEEKTRSTHGVFTVLDQQTGRLENLLKYKPWSAIDSIQMMGDTPIMKGTDTDYSVSALLSYKDGKLAPFLWLKAVRSDLVWADSEHILYTVGISKVGVADANGQVVKTIDLGTHNLYMTGQAQDGKLYLFSNAKYELGYKAVQITTLDLKTFTQQNSTVIPLNQKEGDLLYGMLLPKQ